MAFCLLGLGPGLGHRNCNFISRTWRFMAMVSGEYPVVVVYEVHHVVDDN